MQYGTENSLYLTCLPYSYFKNMHHKCLQNTQFNLHADTNKENTRELLNFYNV